MHGRETIRSKLRYDSRTQGMKHGKDAHSIRADPTRGLRVASSAPPVTLPTAPRAERITIVPRNCDERKVRWITITDRSSIDRFVAFVNERQDGWKRPWDTFPVPEYTVSLETGGTTLGFVWLSSSWIGGHGKGEGALENRLRELTPGEWRTLQGILGVE